MSRAVTIRVDSDVVEMRGWKLGRPVFERHPVDQEQGSLRLLGDLLATSGLLRPGRACEVGLQVESSRTQYRAVQEARSRDSSPRSFQVLLPQGLRDDLHAVLQRRRVHGRAWIAAGPPSRVVETLSERLESGFLGNGLIIDRSSAAVSVFLLQNTSVFWARGSKSSDPGQAASLLLRRAGEVLDGAFGLDYWRINDVAAPDDDRRRLREAREFEAKCDALVGHVSRMQATRS